MDTLTAIHSRRSIRTFTDQPVSEEQIHQLLEAAMIAPSAGNAQPWHFIVIDDKALLHKVPDIHPYAKMALEAPLGILVCGNLTEEKYPGFWVQDCSAATQNILLTATAMGMGSVWAGIYPIEERVTLFRNLCNLPQTIIPLGLVFIGYSTQKNVHKTRFDEKKVSKNMW